MEHTANRHNEYLDRTMQHTVTLLATCDARKNFTWIATGFAGSIHDQRCLSLSYMADRVATLPNQHFPKNSLHIIGDSAFTLQPGLMAPFMDHGNSTQAQSLYNDKHSKTRCVIENTFGFLKNRFRCLTKLEVNLEKATPIIVACCILHNVALKFPDYLQEMTTNDSPDAPTSNSSSGDSYVNPSAAAKQRALCSILS